VSTFNQLRTLTCNLKKDYERQLAHSVNSNQKALWSYVNSKMKIQPLSLICIVLMVLQPAQMRIWLHFLITILLVFLFVKIQLPCLQLTHLVLLLVLILLIFTPEIILSKTQNFQSSKSQSPYGWPIKIIKSMADFISNQLFIIYNKSFNGGLLPQDWRCTQHLFSVR